jgi:hypothetical protein
MHRSTVEMKDFYSGQVNSPELSALTARVTGGWWDKTRPRNGTKPKATNKAKKR